MTAPAPDEKFRLLHMQDMVAAIDLCIMQGDMPAAHLHARNLLHCVQNLLFEDTKRSLEIQSLHQKLRTSKAAFEEIIQSYKAILDAFETFRGNVEQVQQLKSLDELPELLESIKELRSLRHLHLILDKDIFAGRIPAGIGQASGTEMRDQLTQFSPSVHAPCMHLGEIGAVGNPAFFLGREQIPDAGSCFIFALHHKYQRSKIIGIVGAWDPDPTRYSQDKATDFLGHFCDILSCSLITLLEHDQLEELTVRDPLTGANNRAYLERQAPGILGFAARKGLPAHLLFIDLNGFKAVNDQLGHEAGDQVLVAVVRTVQTMIRQYDIFVRMGGDEFVVLLSDTDREKALIFARRLQQCLAGIDVSAVCQARTDLRITAAVGLAQYQDGQSLDELLRAADQSMYAEKLAFRSASPRTTSS